MLPIYIYVEGYVFNVNIYITTYVIINLFNEREFCVGTELIIPLIKQFCRPNGKSNNVVYSGFPLSSCGIQKCNSILHLQFQNCMLNVNSDYKLYVNQLNSYNYL